MDGNSTKQYDLTTKYGSTLSTSANCRIAFDHLGRPYSFTTAGNPASPTAGLIYVPYDINITNGADSLIIRVEAETGYVHLL